MPKWDVSEKEQTSIKIYSKQNIQSLYCEIENPQKEISIKKIIII
jgi:hypothetical protein